MFTLPVKRLASPDNRFVARLVPVSNNPWEISCATLSLSGLPFGERMFAYRGVWSECSRYFAVTEWRHRDTSLGPDMQLIVIDVVGGRECVVDRAENGFIEPMRIAGGEVRYTMLVQGMNERIKLQRKVRDLRPWRPVTENIPAFDGTLSLSQHTEAGKEGGDVHGTNAVDAR